MLLKYPPRARVDNCVNVIGALEPTVVTTIFPQLVTKVNVRGKRFSTLSAGATDGGVCPTALVVEHLIAGTLADLTDLLFVLSAEAEGETMKVEADSAETAIATTINFFTLTPFDMT